MGFNWMAAAGGFAEGYNKDQDRKKESAQRMLEKRMDYWMANGTEFMKERRTKKEQLSNVYNSAIAMGLNPAQAEHLMRQGPEMATDWIKGVQEQQKLGRITDVSSLIDVQGADPGGSMEERMNRTLGVAPTAAPQEEPQSFGDHFRARRAGGQQEEILRQSAQVFGADANVINAGLQGDLEYGAPMQGTIVMPTDLKGIAELNNLEARTENTVASTYGINLSNQYAARTLNSRVAKQGWDTRQAEANALLTASNVRVANATEEDRIRMATAQADSAVANAAWAELSMPARLDVLSSQRDVQVETASDQIAHARQETETNDLQQEKLISDIATGEIQQDLLEQYGAEEAQLNLDLTRAKIRAAGTPSSMEGLFTEIRHQQMQVEAALEQPNLSEEAKADLLKKKAVLGAQAEQARKDWITMEAATSSRSSAFSKTNLNTNYDSSVENALLRKGVGGFDSEGNFVWGPEATRMKNEAEMEVFTSMVESYGDFPEARPFLEAKAKQLGLGIQWDD